MIRAGPFKASSHVPGAPQRAEMIAAANEASFSSFSGREIPAAARRPYRPVASRCLSAS